MFVLVGRRLFLGLIILALAIGFVPIRATHSVCHRAAPHRPAAVRRTSTASCA